eukprot:4606389-Amphidinium_carterae.2
MTFPLGLPTKVEDWRRDFPRGDQLRSAQRSAIIGSEQKACLSEEECQHPRSFSLDNNCQCLAQVCVM